MKLWLTAERFALGYLQLQESKLSCEGEGLRWVNEARLK
jgi:hypothetical protein